MCTSAERAATEPAGCRYDGLVRASKDGAVAFSMRCADAGVDCAGFFTTQTEEELLRHIEVHASVAHPELDIAAVLENVGALIHQT